MPQDEKEDSPNEKALTEFTVRAFSFQSRGRDLNVWPPRSPGSANRRNTFALSVSMSARMLSASGPDGTDGVLL